MLIGHNLASLIQRGAIGFAVCHVMRSDLNAEAICHVIVHGSWRYFSPDPLIRITCSHLPRTSKGIQCPDGFLIPSVNHSAVTHRLI